MVTIGVGALTTTIRGASTKAAATGRAATGRLGERTLIWRDFIWGRPVGGLKSFWRRETPARRFTNAAAVAAGFREAERQEEAARQAVLREAAGSRAAGRNSRAAVVDNQEAADNNRAAAADNRAVAADNREAADSKRRQANSADRTGRNESPADKHKAARTKPARLP
jgi:hypothetical protein